MTEIHQWVAASREGMHPRLVCQVASGWVVMGEAQMLPGYCLLLPDPVVGHLNLLSAPEQVGFLADMARIGDAILAVTQADRINYAIFGNQTPALHAHVFPRWDNEPEELRHGSPWGYDWEAAQPYSIERHGEILKSLKSILSDGTFEADESF